MDTVIDDSLSWSGRCTRMHKELDVESIYYALQLGALSIIFCAS